MAVEIPLQEALFPVRREVYYPGELGGLRRIFTLKMGAICSSEKAVLKEPHGVMS
jgi:hypothetical protein